MDPVRTVTAAPAATVRFVTRPSSARSNPVPVALGLGAALIALDTWRTGAFPTGHALVVDAALGGGLVVAAMVAPDPVTWLLGLGLLYVVLVNEAPIADGIGRFVSSVGG